MRLILDGQLPPVLAPWITQHFGLECIHLVDMHLRHASDRTVFLACKVPHNVIVTKDSDFVDLATALGTPPQVLWLRVGNCTNAVLRKLFTVSLSRCLEELNGGEPVVELLSR